MFSFSSKLEDFPAEIFHHIFDYLSGDDILRIFLCFNDRFNNLIKKLRLNTVEISAWTRRDITTFLKNFSSFLSTRCYSLRLWNKNSYDGTCSANIEFIFSSLLDSYQLKSLLNNLEHITFIRPIIDTAICLPDILLQSFIVHSLNDRIIFRKRISLKKIDSIMMCSNEVMRSLLVDNGGIYNQIFVNFQNSINPSILPFIKHLKLYVNSYSQQWIYMLPFIVNTLSELTILIIDNQFEHYNGNVFSSLFQNIGENCHLHFYLQFLPNFFLTNRDVDTLVQSFQNEFYIKHQSNVTIVYSRSFQIFENCPLLIYTSPFCAPKITLINNQQIMGTCVSIL